MTDSLGNLKDSVRGGDVVDLEFALPVEQRVLELIQGIEGTDDVKVVDTNRVRVRVSMSEDWLPKMTDRIHDFAKVKSIKMTEPSLDDVFLKYTEESRGV